MTKNGKIILDIIESVTCHPTAEDVYQIAIKEGNKMSLATVYNNLSALYDEGLIRKLTNPDQPDRFDKLLRHDHLVCKRCGKISDLFLRDLTDILEDETKMEFDSYDLTIFNECEECKAKFKEEN